MKTKGVNFLALTRDPALHAEVKQYAIDELGNARRSTRGCSPTVFRNPNWKSSTW